MTLFAVSRGTDGTDDDRLQAVAVEGAGAVVAAGTSYGDAFVWKRTAEGTTLWAVRGGGTGNDQMNGVAVDGAGAVVAAGYFQSSTATFGSVALTRAGSYNAVVWKLSAEGTTLWAVRGGGTLEDDLNGVAVDGAGAVVAAGHFRSSLVTFGDVALNSAGGLDAMVWKMSFEGTTLWAVRGGGTNSDYMNGVAVDGAGAVVAAGNVRSPPATFGDVALTSAWGVGAVLWKLRAEGTTLWAVCGGGTSTEELTGVAVDGAGAVVAAGVFKRSPATFGGVALTPAGSSDAFVWKVSAEGTTWWAVRGGGSGSDYLNGVAVDSTNAVVAAGYSLSLRATFGGLTLTTAGSGDAVVWKVSDEGTTLWAVRGGGSNADELTGVAVVTTGAVVAAGYFNSSLATFGGVALTCTRSGDAMLLWNVRAWDSFSNSTNAWLGFVVLCRRRRPRLFRSSSIHARVLILRSTPTYLQLYRLPVLAVGGHHAASVDGAGRARGWRWMARVPAIGGGGWRGGHGGRGVLRRQLPGDIRGRGTDQRWGR